MEFSDYRLLPRFLISKGAVLNPKNEDNRSFGHAIAYFYHPNDWGSNPFRKAPLPDRFVQHGLDKIKYPVKLDEIPALEDQLHIRINIFTFDDPEGYRRHSLYISKKYKPEEINLLYWDGRYAWIKHFSRLFSDARKYDFIYFYINDTMHIIFYLLYSYHNKAFYCTRCLTHFIHERFLRDHQVVCPNEINPDNLIDRLKTEDGYSKEIRKRNIIRTICYAKKLEGLLTPEELESVQHGRYEEKTVKKLTNGNSLQQESDGLEKTTPETYSAHDLHKEGAGLLNLRRKSGFDGHLQQIKKTSLGASSLLLLQGDDIDDTKF